jgi:hypothetical protein
MACGGWSCGAGFPFGLLSYICDYGISVPTLYGGHASFTSLVRNMSSSEIVLGISICKLVFQQRYLLEELLCLVSTILIKTPCKF